MSFKFRVADIPPDGIVAPYEMTSDDLDARLADLEGERIRVAAPLKIELKIEPTGNRVVVRGRLETVLRLECARCLEAFDYPVAENVFVVYTAEESDLSQEELEAEELNQEFFDGEEIDVWPVLQEHLVMTLPIKPLCDDDCKGLCPVCGRNKNTGQCQCETVKGHPGLARLSEIREKLPK